MPKATKGIFMEWDSLNNDQPIDVSSEDQAEVHMGTNDTSIPISPPAFPKTIHIKDLYNYVLFLQSQKGKLEEEQQAVESEAAFITGQDSSAHLPAELKILLEKMSVVTKIVGELKELMESLELDFPADLKEILTKLTEFATSLSALTSRVAKLKVLDAIPDRMNKVVVALDLRLSILN
ncbi:hypothetical protein Tco_0554832 [Tanacetum coccineum]